MPLSVADETSDGLAKCGDLLGHEFAIRAPELVDMHGREQVDASALVTDGEHERWCVRCVTEFFQRYDDTPPRGTHRV